MLGSPRPSKSGFNSQTLRPIQNLKALYEAELLILPTLSSSKSHLKKAIHYQAVEMEICYRIAAAQHGKVVARKQGKDRISKQISISTA